MPRLPCLFWAGFTNPPTHVESPHHGLHGPAEVGCEHWHSGKAIPGLRRWHLILFCLPQKSVPQDLFGVVKRLIGSTKGMKGAILHSIPKTINKCFWLSLRWVVAVSLGAMCYLMFLDALWGHFSALCRAHALREHSARPRQPFWKPLLFGILHKAAGKAPVKERSQPRPCAGSGKQKTLVPPKFFHNLKILHYESIYNVLFATRFHMYLHTHMQVSEDKDADILL